MFKITQNEWDKRSEGAKSVINGQKYIMGGKGCVCCLTPVEISEDGLELQRYSFEEWGIAYSVLAWDEEEAMRIAKECGHLKVENLRLKQEEAVKKSTFDYQMLGRLQSDCDYYLGYGNRSKNRLYYKDEQVHIDKMKELHNSFPNDEKPEWLTFEDILSYEKQMVNC